MRKTVNAVIYSADPDARVRLKDALGNLIALRVRADAVKSWLDAVKTAAQARNISIVFVDSAIEPAEFTNFRAAMKGLSLLFRPSFVVTLRPEHNTPEIVSEHIMQGVEGFLSEPFTLQSVEETLGVVIENREKRIADHAKAIKTLQFLITDACTALDDTALERLENGKRGGGASLKRMSLLREQLAKMKDRFTEQEIFSLVEKAIKDQAGLLDLSKFSAHHPKVKFAPHPGKVITKIIEGRSISLDRLAEFISTDERTIRALLNESGALTPELARGFAKFLGSSEDYWLGLQKSYEDYMNSRR